MTEIARISYSQIGQWMKCPFKWYLSYEEKYKPKKYPKSVSTGGYVHEFLSNYYTDVIEGCSSIEEQVSRLNTRIQEKYTSTPSIESKSNLVLAGKIVRRFIQDFAPVADSEFETVATEYKFEYTTETPKGRPFIIEGYIDRIKRHKKSKVIWQNEFKGVYQTRWWTDMQMMMDLQQSIYCQGLRKLGVPVHGIEFTMYNYYEYKDWQNTPLEKLFHSEQITRSEKELDAVEYNVGMHMDKLLEHAGDYPRSLSKDNCQFCWFQLPCLLNLKGIPLESCMAGDFTKRPLKGSANEKSEDYNSEIL